MNGRPDPKRLVQEAREHDPEQCRDSRDGVVDSRRGARAILQTFLIFPLMGAFSPLTVIDRYRVKAVKGGAKEPRPPLDHGVMFTRSFEDPDGHIWELVWMDPAHVQ